MIDNNSPIESPSEADLKESLEILRTRVGQNTAVFACFGSAAQHAQFFESALAEFLRDYNKIANQSLTVQDFELLDQRLQKKTLGALLKEFSRYVTINDPKITKLLELALDQRNFLIHHFFLERDDKFGSEQDRIKLLSELVSIDNLLQDAATIIRGMGIALSRAIQNRRKIARRRIAGSSQETEADDQKVLLTAEVKLPENL